MLKAGRGDRGYRASTAAAGELERDPAAERVAREVGAVEAGAPHLVLDGVGERFGSGGDGRGEWRRAPEARQVHRNHVEALLQARQHRPPAAPGVADAVDEHERLAGAAAMVVERGHQARLRRAIALRVAETASFAMIATYISASKAEFFPE